MGSLKKWTAVLLAACLAVSSAGISVDAQALAGNAQDTEQQRREAGEGYEEEDGKEAGDRDVREEDGKEAGDRDVREGDGKEAGDRDVREGDGKEAGDRDVREGDGKEAGDRDVREGDGKEAGTLNFLLLENDQIKTPGVQNIAVSLGQDGVKIEKAELTYRNVSAEKDFTAEAAEIADNMVKFTMDYKDKSQSGIYELVSVRYQADGRTYEVLLDGLGMDVSFGVNQEVETEPDEVLMDVPSPEEVEANVVTFDENGNTVSEQTMEDVLQEAESVKAEAKSGRAANGAARQMIIVLDPGHDWTHAGARGNGCNEEELALKIAQYCKTELQKYTGVTVYMTRSGNDCPNGGGAVSSAVCNAKRVEYAVAKKADVYVSLHLNSSVNTGARGVGVYYPNSNYRPDIGEEGKGLATDIYRKLSALGLSTWAGGILIRNTESNPPTLYPDGSHADYLGVIRRSKEAGIPAVLVEHAFLSNSADVSEFLSSDEKLKKLGIADAQGIAGYYKLSKKASKPSLEGIQSRSSKKLRLNWSEVSGAVSYQVYRGDSADGKFKKIAEISKCQYDDGSVKAGTTYYYKVRAVASDGKKSSFSKVKSGAALVTPQINGVVSRSGGNLKITWKTVGKADKYEIWRSEASNGKYTKVATASGKNYTDKVDTQKNYFYKVRARGGQNDGYSGYSKVVSGWAVKKTEIRSVSSQDSTSLRIKWKKVENASAYQIRRSTSKKGTYQTIAQIQGNKNSYVDKGLEAKTPYYYKVEAMNYVNGKTGYSGYSSAISGQTITATSMVYVKSVDSETMELKWKADPKASAYSIKRSRQKKGVYEKIAEIRDCNITQYQDRNIVSGQRYYYVVETMIDKNGVMQYSGDSKPASAYSLQKVNILSVLPAEKGFTLNWEKVPGANCYEIMRSTQMASGFTEIARVRSADAASFTDESVTAGTKYYYRVRAVCEGKYTGYGSYGKVAESNTTIAKRR
ncbi:MAG: hypothetical protein HFH36_05310 [Lachnospiraceae bacterium]|nr:hypothetical protein [Lachnospiraceae bacterium]